jgi:hypothetical protein
MGIGGDFLVVSGLDRVGDANQSLVGFRHEGGDQLVDQRGTGVFT